MRLDAEWNWIPDRVAFPTNRITVRPTDQHVELENSMRERLEYAKKMNDLYTGANEASTGEELGRLYA